MTGDSIEQRRRPVVDQVDELWIAIAPGQEATPAEWLRLAAQVGERQRDGWRVVALGVRLTRPIV